MAEQQPPVWMQAGTYSARHDRLVTGLLVDRTITAAGAFVKLQGGVVGPKNQLEVAASAGVNVTVSPGIAMVPRTTGSAPGIYLCFNETSTVVSTTLVATSGHTRYDVVIARVRDSEESGVDNEWTLEVVQGTSGTTPTIPTDAYIYGQISTNTYIKLAALLVNNTTVASVTDLRQFIAGGGLHPHWGTRPDVSPGRLAYNVTSKVLEVSDGAGWDQVFTKGQLETYFSAYRPASAYDDGPLEQNSFDNWNSRITDTDTDAQMATAIKVTRRSPSGMFKVYLSAWGKAGAANVSGHMSVEITQTGIATPLAGNAFGRGPSFYNTTYIVSESSVLYNLGSTKKDIDVNFTVHFHKLGSSGATAEVYYQKVRLIVDPVL